MAFRLVYVSSGNQGLQSSDLQDILSVSQRFNAEQGITGMLLYLEGNFIQVLEGEQDPVENLAQRISRDRRHRDFQILQREMSGDLLFPDWSMGLKVIDPADSPTFEDAFALTRRAVTEKLPENDKTAVRTLFNTFMEVNALL